MKIFVCGRRRKGPLKRKTDLEHVKQRTLSLSLFVPHYLGLRFLSVERPTIIDTAP